MGDCSDNINLDISNPNNNTSRLPLTHNEEENILSNDKNNIITSMPIIIQNQTTVGNNEKAESKPLLDTMQYISAFFQKHFLSCKKWTIMTQIMIIYCIFIFIFVVVLVTCKILQVNRLVFAQSKKNYYTNIVREMIEAQRGVKIQLDQLNNEHYLETIENAGVFFKIFTHEMIYHDILITTNDINTPSILQPTFTFSGGNTSQFYKNLNNEVSFSLSYSLQELIEETMYPAYHFKNFIPYYYHFVPIIYQNMKAQGMPPINFYFIATNKDKSSPPLYFKYPLEDPDVLTAAIPVNNKPYDFVLDPIGKDFIQEINKEYYLENKEERDEIIKKANETNWYFNIESKLEKKPNYHISQMIRLSKVRRDSHTDDYLMKYIGVTYEIPGTFQNFPMLFAVKINQTAMTWPNVIRDKHGDTHNIDYISLINYEQEFQTNIKVPYDGIYERDYNIDDNNTMIVNMPKFIDNLYKYTMDFNRIKTQKEIYKSQTKMIKYSDLTKVKLDANAFAMNSYFEKDATLLELLVFLNNNLNYYNTYTTSEDNPPDRLPCSITDIERYYTMIKNYSINCFKDFCFYNKCNSKTVLYVEKQEAQYQPNCYCLPLYCMDNKTPQNFTFMSEIKKLFPNEVEKFYAFNFAFKNYSEYFDLKNHHFQCRLNMYQKEENEITTVSSFNAQIYLRRLLFDKKSTLFEMFLLDNKDIDREITGSFDDHVYNIIWIVYIIYFSCLLIMLVVLTIIMYKNIIILQDKIQFFETYRKNLIPNSQEDIIVDVKTDLEKKVENDKIEEKSKQPNKDNKDNKDLKEIQLIQDEISKKDEKDMLSKEGDIEKKDEKENQPKEGEIENKILVNVIEEKDKKIKETKTEIKININDEDELDKITNMIKKNINDNQLEFNINENLTKSIQHIKRQYDEIKDVKELQSRLLLSRKKSRKVQELFDELSEYINNDNDFSIYMLDELFSTSDRSLIDFENIKTNFYYTDNYDNRSIINTALLQDKLEDDQSNSTEMTDIKKVEGAINYYMDNIHTYWTKQYNELKREEEKKGLIVR